VYFVKTNPRLRGRCFGAFPRRPDAVQAAEGRVRAAVLTTGQDGSDTSPRGARGQTVAARFSPACSQERVYDICPRGV